MKSLGTKRKEPYISTTNACKLCKPLGACLVFRGIEGGLPYLHGSQGCATYMRRYVISHFREPMDIASSSLGEKHAVYGGGPNLKLGLKNVISKYKTKLVGIATTCLTETIGDDVHLLVNEFRKEFDELIRENGSPELVTVSTPSYSGTHMEGYLAAVKAVVSQLSTNPDPHPGINIFPGLVSPADIRFLKTLFKDWQIHATILPDISESLDGALQPEYEKLPHGGTRVSDIRRMSGAVGSIEFGHTISDKISAGKLLFDRHNTPFVTLGMPIGLRETDRFFQCLEKLTGKPAPECQTEARGRLLDAFVDGHKYLFGKRILVYGEEDLVVGITSFLSEIGTKPVLCASGGKSGMLGSAIENACSDLVQEIPIVMEGVDFHEIKEIAEEVKPDLIIGNSKGYHLAKTWGIPLIRVGFPIHDRFGGQRIRLLGYEGSLEFMDRIINEFIRVKQERSDIGYSYI